MPGPARIIPIGRPTGFFFPLRKDTAEAAYANDSSQRCFANASKQNCRDPLPFFHLALIFHNNDSLQEPAITSITLHSSVRPLTKICCENLTAQATIFCCKKLS